MYAAIQTLAKIGKKIDKLDTLCKQYSPDAKAWIKWHLKHKAA